MKKYANKNKRSETIEREIERAKKVATEMTISAALKKFQETKAKRGIGVVNKTEIEDIAAKASYSFFEMGDDEQKEIAAEAYSNAVDYLKSCKNLRYVPEDSKLYNVFHAPAPEIDDPVINSIAAIIEEYQESYDIAPYEGDIKSQMHAMRMIGALTTALRIRCKTENNVKMWLRKVMPNSDQFRLMGIDVTFENLYSRLINDISICSIFQFLNQRAKDLVITELIDRYGSKVKDIYDKHHYNYILEQYASRTAK